MIFPHQDGSVNGTAYGIFLSSDLSSKIFCAVWHLSTAWLIAVNFSRHRMRNYFRIESIAHESKYVQIEKPQEQVIFLDDGGKLIKRFQHVEAKLKKYFGYVLFGSKSYFRVLHVMGDILSPSTPGS